MSFSAAEIVQFILRLTPREPSERVRAVIEAMVQLTSSSALLVAEGVNFDELDATELAQSAAHAQTKAAWTAFQQALAFAAQHFATLTGRQDADAVLSFAFHRVGMPPALIRCLVRHTELLPLGNARPVVGEEGRSAVGWCCTDGTLFSRADVLELRAQLTKKTG